MTTFAETADSSLISKGLNKETLSWFQMWGNKPQEIGRQLLKASKQDSHKPEVNGLLSDSHPAFPSGPCPYRQESSLAKSAPPSTLCPSNTWRVAALSGVSYSRNIPAPLATKHGLGRNAQSQKVKRKSSSSLSALRQPNSWEQNIPCSVLEFGFLCKIIKEHSNKEKVWGSTVNISSIVYISMQLKDVNLSMWLQWNTLILLSSLSLWIKLLTFLQPFQDWAKWIRTTTFYQLHEEHKYQ